MKKYLLFYVTFAPRGSTKFVSAAGEALTFPAETADWWYLELNADGVYVRPGGRNVPAGYRHWAGQLPANWLDCHGNLRNSAGDIVFTASLP
jgi:hypothetical protein